MKSPLRQFGKMTAAILKTVMAPQVGREDMCDAIGYVENAGTPGSVVPDFIGQLLFDTSGLDFYRSFGVAAGEWAPAGIDTETLTELGFLDGAMATNVTASKAAIIGAGGILALPTAINGAPGVGVSGGTGTILRTSVERVGGFVRTSMIVDLTGLNGGGSAGDVIGVNGAGVAHFGQLTVAKNGIVLGGRVQCLETPAGSNVDVDIWSADEATGVEDTAISALSNEVQLINHGNWAVGEIAGMTLVPVANQYIYLTSGAATDATFTAGQFLIEFFGYDA